MARRRGGKRTAASEAGAPASNMSAAKILHPNPQFPVSIKQESLDAYPEQCTVLHYHEEIELLCVQSGELHENVGSRLLHIRTGEAVFINTKVLHYCERSSESAKFIMVQVHPDLMQQEFLRRKFFDPVLQDHRFSYIKLDSQLWHKEAIHYIENIYAHREDALAPLLISSDLLRLWMLFYQHVTDGVQETINPDLIIGRQMVGYIQRNYRSQIILPDIAHAGGVSVSKCCSIFHKYFHLSPMLYLKEYRLDRASSMLMHENASITEIAYRAGYNDAAYFSRSFKEMTGKSPRAYREAAVSGRV
jgi:AraC-like DNA-binding protein/mannose-6-phosphate isomerase-like protein (cupin superfamily)